MKIEKMKVRVIDRTQISSATGALQGAVVSISRPPWVKEPKDDDA